MSMTHDTRSGPRAAHPCNRSTTSSTPAAPGLDAIPHTCFASPDFRHGLRHGDDDRNDELRADCRGCQAERAALERIYRWEDVPFDPDDDLRVIAEYPSEQRRLRELQEVIRRDPVFRVVELIGKSSLRRDFLRAVGTDGVGFDREAACTFFDDQVCRCESMPDSDIQFYARHHEAARCRWCMVKDALTSADFDALTAHVAREQGEWANARDAQPEQQSEGQRVRELRDRINRELGGGW